MSPQNSNQAQWRLERKKSKPTCWTADSSSLERFNWTSCGLGVLDADQAVRVCVIVRELVLPDCHSDDGTRLTRDSWKFHQLLPISLGWKAEGAAERLAVVLWAVALECKMDYAPLRSVCRSAHAWTNDVGTELMFNDFHCTSLRGFFPWRFGVSDLSCDVGGGGGDGDKASRSSSDLGANASVPARSAALIADPSSKHSPYAFLASMKNDWFLAHGTQCARQSTTVCRSCALDFTLAA